MKKELCFLLACAMAGMVTPYARGGTRTGGGAEILYETVSGGAAGYSTNGVYALGGTLGQNGFIHVSSNGTTRLLNGYWKAEGNCLLFPTRITDIWPGTNSVGIAFNVMKSNTYTVVYINEEDGGLLAASSAWTNEVVAPFTATGGLGSIVTVYDDLIGVTNRARYYRIKCE